MSKTDLLVIDVQRAFFDGDQVPAVYNGEQILTSPTVQKWPSITPALRTLADVQRLNVRLA
jgi:nicotinamidase-related amidase